MSTHPPTLVVRLDQGGSGLLESERSDVPSESVAPALACQAVKDHEPQERTESPFAVPHYVLTSSSSSSPSFSPDILEVETIDDPDEPKEIFEEAPARNLHKKPPSSFRSISLNPQSPDQPQSNQLQERFHCALCRKTFACRTSARGHLKMNTCRKNQVSPE